MIHSASDFYRLFNQCEELMEKIKTQKPAKYKITAIENVTHDTKSFHFELPENAALDLLPGDHMMMHAEIDGQIHRRPYTPTSTPDDKGLFELIIKHYPLGLMSNYIHSCRVGDEILLEGPTPGGHFDEGMASHVGMVAGGAGITPMIAIIRTAIRRKWRVEMTLLFANKTINDIILREEFEKHAAENDNFNAIFSVDGATPDFTGHAGFIDENMLKENLPPPDIDPIIFLCGPPMMEFKLREKILALGYEKKRLVIP
jgi:cytochrome-b5 reductase